MPFAEPWGYVWATLFCTLAVPDAAVSYHTPLSFHDRMLGNDPCGQDPDSDGADSDKDAEAGGIQPPGVGSVNVGENPGEGLQQHKVVQHRRQAVAGHGQHQAFCHIQPDGSALGAAA